MMRTLCLFTLLAACAGKDDATEADSGASATATPAPASDPDVDTYVPPEWGPTEPVRVVYLGDSITAGVGASKNSLAYTALLAEDRSAKWSDYADLDLESTFSAIEVVDVSVGGATTNSLINGQLPALDAQLGATASGETIVVMTIGGNDAQNALNPLVEPREILDALIANIEIIVDDLQARFPDGVYIYATNVYEPTDGVGTYAGCFFGISFLERLPELYRAEDEFRSLAERKGFAAIDLRGHFEGHGFNAGDSSIEAYDAEDPSLWFEDDCIHPNDRGHHELRRLFHAAIQGIDLPLEP
ncbi:MAG: lysophospholipase L1-like esterase [Myxococcota bacterium]|jgi:lysophospholipase L1-like esterase